jgi:hypothetical protein
MSREGAHDDFQGTERFELVRRIGAGGMGVVYEAFDRQRNARLALKTLQRLEPRALYLFKQEFRALTDVAHPNLVTLYELISVADHWFFTMELVDGVHFLNYVRGSVTVPLPTDRGHGTHARPSGATRADLITGDTKARAAAARPEAARPEENPATVATPPSSLDALTADYLHGDSIAALLARAAHLPLTDAEQFDRLRAGLRQLAAGMGALHAAGKLHRDIKPSNVLVTTEGRVVLLDFGLVADVAASALDREPERSIAGTAAYMAPEQAAGQALSPATDWYAVGVMIYEALTGLRPHQGTTREVLAQKCNPPPPPNLLVPGLPHDLAHLCADLLAVRPADRPTGEEVCRRLRGESNRSSYTVPLVPAPSAFVGRAQHLHALEDAYRALAGGRTVAMHVHGRSGMGKSLLVERFLSGLADRDDAVVLAGRCYEQESVPYKALDSLVDALTRYLVRRPDAEVAELLPPEVAALARLFPVLRRVARIAAAPVHAADVADAHELRRRAFTALREMLSRLGRRRRLVLSIDDLQWGDTDSAALLSELLRPPDPPLVCLLCAYRSEYAATSPCLLALRGAAASAADVDRRELSVEPLNNEEARALALDLLAGAPDAAARAEDVARESGGSPFFVRQLAQFLRGGAVLAGGVVALDDVLWQQVAGLPAAARRLLEIVTVSGRPLRQRDAYRAAELAADDRAALAVLRVNHYVRSTGPDEADEVETFHDRIRETVVARLPAAARADCHRRLAKILEESPAADAETLAIHCHGAGDLERAGIHYGRAADEAAQALAFDRAAKLYRLALELRPLDGDAGRTMRTRLANALANAGRGPDAAQQYLQATEGAGALERVELERRAAYQFCISGHLDQGQLVLRSVLRRVGMSLPATQTRALIALLVNRFRLWLRGLRFRPRDPAEIAAEELARIDVTWSVGAGLGTKNIVLSPAFQALNLRLALAAGEPRRAVRALCWEAANRANEGRRAWDATQRLLDAAADLAAPLDDPYLEGMLALGRGIGLGFHRGRWKECVDEQERAVAVFRTRCTGAAWELSQANTFLLWCLSWMGEWGDMGQRSARIIQEAHEKGDLYTAATLGGYTEPLARLADDRPDRAARAIEESMTGWTRDAYHIQHMTALMSWTYVDLYRGKGAAAYERHLADWPRMKKALILIAEMCRVAMSELRGRSALAVASEAADPKAALADAAACARRMRRERVPHADALSLPLLAGLAALQGDRQAALMHLRDAAKAFDALNMGLFAATTRRRAGEILGNEEGVALITDASSWMLARKIRDPARMTRAFLPWAVRA